MEKKTEKDIKSEFSDFLERNKARFNTAEKVELLQKAFNYAHNAHLNMLRYSGEAYIYHPFEVAKIVTEKIGLGDISVAAALLHDVPHKTEYSIEDIKTYFGEKIFSIVESLQKIKNTEYFETHAQASVLRQILLSISSDIRVIFIKIADKLHSIRTVQHLPSEKAKRVIDDVLNVYAPLAHRLGLYDIKQEMEDLCLKSSNPYIFNKINKQLQSSEKERVLFIERFIRPIEEELNKNNINFDIKGRSKSIYSVWKKMQTKAVPLEEIYDIFAIRIIFKPKNTENENIEALQIGTLITNLYTEKKERRRNWLKEGKDTGYKALHTTVMSNEGKWVEVQIRSEKMHEVAEHGLAAHWKYKGLEEKKTEFDNKVKEILEYLSEDNSTALTFIDNLKLNLFTSEIYAFTPKGEVKNLPKGASILDFAFKIHTDLALKSIAGKVNGKSQALNYKLKNGDQVELITTKKQNIQKEWLNFVITQKAMYVIKKHFKEDIQADIEKGKQILEKTLKEKEVSNIGKCIDNISKHLTYRNKEKLFEDIATKKISDLLLSNTIKTFCSKERKSRFWKIKMPFSGSSDLNKNLLPDIYKSAKCCNPVPGDEIIGIKNPNGEDIIYIHNINCLTAETEKRFGSISIEAHWTSYKAISVLKDVKISGTDEPGLVSKISSIILKYLTIKIKSFSFDAKDNNFKISAKLYVEKEEDLENLIKKINKLSFVSKITVLD